MRVLLVANYEPDHQESMLRFAAALHAGLRDSGIGSRLIRPVPAFGKLASSSTKLGKWLGYIDKFVLFPPRLRAAARSADVVHICDHSNAMYVLHVAARPHLVTCNDMLAIRSAHGEFPQNRTGWSGRILQRWILRNLRRAQRLTCISQATRTDVLRLTGQPPEHVSVTHMGQNFAYSPVAEVAQAAEARRCGEPFDPAVFARHDLPADPYLLHVGGTQWYKNRDGVIAAHAALGAGAPQLEIVNGGVDNAKLAALYSGAELLLFPSLEEGFGWPIVEAQACGCRVVTTGKPPMTEVGGEAAIYVSDPSNPAEVAERVRSVLAQDAETRRCIVSAGLSNAARFSTDRMTCEYRAIYEDLVSQ
jgi:hypothetical protein